MRFPFALKIPIIFLAAVLALSACGLWKSTKDATSDAAQAVFIAKVKQMNLEIVSRASLNSGNDGKPLPVVVRVYQLKDAKALETATYIQLLEGDRERLKTDLLSTYEATLAPDAAVKLSEPMQDDAKFVGVVAFFRDPAHAQWQVVVPKSRWRKTDPVRLTVRDSQLELEEDVW
jgi:type VI secretion system protein VasD